MNSVRLEAGDWRSRSARVRCVLVVVANLSALDLVLTLALMHTTGMYEANPLAAALARCSDWSLGCFKVLCTAATVWCLWRARASWKAEAAACACLLVLVALTVRWTQVIGELDTGGLAEAAGAVDHDASWVALAAR